MVMGKALVTGATGKQGGGVVENLLSGNKVAIRALTRNPDSPAAKSLAAKGVELVKGSLTDESSLVTAMDGCWAAFLVTDSYGKGGAETEIRQGKTFIDAAKKANLKHLVYTSVEGAERNSGIPHFDSKFQVEEYLRASGLPSYTILRPVAFYENFPSTSGFGTFVGFGFFGAALGGKKLQFVSVRDIGWFAAKALEDPEKYSGRVIPLAGDNLSISEVQDAYQNANGVRPWVAPIPGVFIRLLPYDIRTMFQWFYNKGYEANISALRTEHPDLLTFEQWVRLSNSDKTE
jgi:uncharacterized protein YbjT (DUF2867 family)